MHNYVQNKRVLDGVVVVRLMRECKLVPEVRTLNAVLNGLVRIRHFNVVLQLFDEFVNVGLRPDGYMYTVVVKSLCELKDLHKAKEVIWYAESNGCELSVVTYNVLIHGLCKIQRVWEAVEIKNMLSRKGLKADKPSIGICLRRRLRDRVRRHDPLPNRFRFHRQTHCLQAHERLPRQAHQEDRRRRCSGEARGGERSQSERLQEEEEGIQRQRRG